MSASRPRTHDELAELLGAYALDALDDVEGERSDVERHLVGCARCRAEVQDHREVAALLASEGAPAPEGVWARIAEGLETAPPALDRSLFVVGGSGPRRAAGTAGPGTPARRWRRGAALLAAAAAVAVVAAIGVAVVDLEGRVDETEDNVAGPPEPPPEARVVELAPMGEAGDPRVRAIVRPGGGSTLHAEELPALRSARTYQLWGITGDGAVSLAVLGRNPGEVPFTAGEGVHSLAITAEPVPGRPAPTGRTVVVGPLAAA